MQTEILDCQTENQPQAEPLAQPLSAGAGSTPSPKPPPPFARRHLRGKVARLPLHTRNLVNQALRDGSTYANVIALLAAHGFRGFNKHDLIAWTKRGYRQWLAEQERFELGRQRSERTAALLGSLREDGRSDLADLNESIMSAQFNELLEAMDESRLKQFLAENPKDYFHLAKAVTTFATARAQRQQFELERLKYELEMRKIQEREARRRAPQGITPEIRAKIDAAAKLF
jgi:hypothetical protein